MRRIHAAPHPEAGTANEEALGAEVRVTFDDGADDRQAGSARRSAAAPTIRCRPRRSPPNSPIAPARALPPAQVERLQRMLETLETAPSLKAVVAAIATPARLAAE